MAMNLAQLGIDTYLGDNSVVVRSDLYRDKVDALGIKTFIGMNIVNASDSSDGLRLTLENIRGRKAKKQRREEVIVDVLVSAVRLPVIDLPAQLGAPIVYAPEIGGLVPRRGLYRRSWAWQCLRCRRCRWITSRGLIIKQARITALSIGVREGLVAGDALDKELAEFKRDLVTTNSSYYNVILRFEQGGLQSSGYYAEPM